MNKSSEPDGSPLKHTRDPRVRHSFQLKCFYFPTLRCGRGAEGTRGLLGEMEMSGGEEVPGRPADGDGRGTEQGVCRGRGRGGAEDRRERGLNAAGNRNEEDFNRNIQAA